MKWYPIPMLMLLCMFTVKPLFTVIGAPPAEEEPANQKKVSQFHIVLEDAAQSEGLGDNECWQSSPYEGSGTDGMIDHCSTLIDNCTDCASSYYCDPCAGKECANADCSMCWDPSETPDCGPAMASCGDWGRLCNSVAINYMLGPPDK